MFNPPSRVILASASPRRKDLLSTLIRRFDVVPANVDETPVREDPQATALRLAVAKALVISRANPDALVIAGDTVVAIEDEAEWTQLGKPGSDEEAKSMLARLSGREHWVFTGVALQRGEQHDEFVVGTRVIFRELGAAEIEAYVASGEPMDKAGGYAIQAGAAPFVGRWEGSLSNVIGLPIEELEVRLRRFLS